MSRGRANWRTKRRMAISRSRSCYRGGDRNIEEAIAISRRRSQYRGGDRNIEEATAISRRRWQSGGGDGNNVPSYAKLVRAKKGPLGTK